MAVGDRFKKFDLERLRTYEKYDSEGTLKINAKSLIPEAVKHINDSVEEKIKAIVTEKVENIPVWFEYDREKQKELIGSLFETRLQEEFGLEDITDIEKESLIDKITCHVSGFGILQTYLEQSNVDAIIVNSTNSVMLQVGGKVLDTEMSLDEKQLEFLIKSIKSKAKGKIPSPVGSLKFNDYIITVIDRPVASMGVIVKIKKVKNSLGLNDLILSKFLTKELADFIVSLINSKERIIISGDMLSGKTTLIDNILVSALHSSRTVIVEDSPQITANYSRHIKLSVPDVCTDLNRGNLLSEIWGFLPEYVIFDSKNQASVAEFIENLPEKTSAILTQCASTPDSALSKLVAGQNIYARIPEKQAKQKVLSTFGYIIHLDKDRSGNCRISSIHEINITKNSAQILKELYSVENQIHAGNDSDFDPILQEVSKSSIKSRFNF